MNNGFEASKISPLSKDWQDRPFWSVMIPTYNPSEKYLEETLRCVLSQDPGVEQMQIEIVDDCSPKVDVAALVRQIAGDRVGVYRSPINQGWLGLGILASSVLEAIGCIFYIRMT